MLGGLAWEQHVALLDDRAAFATSSTACAPTRGRSPGHPALLGWTIGNEIPAPVVRWHGRRRTEQFLRRLYEAVKAEDEAALVTYVNYPTTEYLDLGFLDLVCFNVFLERRQDFRAYLDRLQNLAGDRPLILTEIGLDSAANGLERAGRARCAGRSPRRWRPAAPARSSSRGPTNGIAAARTSRAGTSGSPTARGARSPRCAP